MTHSDNVLNPPFSPSSSKQRKNVISCVTVHDSPESDCSTGSPYAMESRAVNIAVANGYDPKLNGHLDNYIGVGNNNNGNPRTIIIPPLKNNGNDGLGECERLLTGKTHGREGGREGEREGGRGGERGTGRV